MINWKQSDIKFLIFSNNLGTLFLKLSNDVQIYSWIYEHETLNSYLLSNKDCLILLGWRDIKYWFDSSFSQFVHKNTSNLSTVYVTLKYYKLYFLVIPCLNVSLIVDPLGSCGLSAFAGTTLMQPLSKVLFGPNHLESLRLYQWLIVATLHCNL